MLNRGDIVLVTFPFTDLTGMMVRPAVVVSSDSFNRSSEDAIFLFITAKTHRSLYDFRVNKSDPDFTGTGLKKASTFRASKVMCLEQGLARRHLGRASQSILDKTSAALKLLLDI
jgi:mRNA interferase MazF